MKMEKSIYDQAVMAVESGEKFKVDLTRRNLTVGKKYLIHDGRYDGKLTEIGCFGIETLESLYDTYKHSRPSERSESKRRRYFKALGEDELDDDDMLYGMDREVAQVMLEAYLLCWILSGTFVWDEESMGKWFWQSSNDKDLVILRSWVDGK